MLCMSALLESRSSDIDCPVLEPPLLFKRKLKSRRFARWNYPNIIPPSDAVAKLAREAVNAKPTP